MIDPAASMPLEPDAAEPERADAVVLGASSSDSQTRSAPECIGVSGVADGCCRNLPAASISLPVQALDTVGLSDCMLS